MSVVLTHKGEMRWSRWIMVLHGTLNGRLCFRTHEGYWPKKKEKKRKSGLKEGKGRRKKLGKPQRKRDRKELDSYVGI
jgi:hypothetical protein